MSSLTKTERNRIHKVRERDRIRKQAQTEGLPVPPLLDPDVLGRGPGDGPSPRGADTGDEETKPSAAEVARETRAGFNARWEPVPAIELVSLEGRPNTFIIPEKKEGDVRPPSKQVMRDIHEYKMASRDTNLRGPVDPEADAKAVEAAEGDDGPKETAKTKSTDDVNPVSGEKRSDPGPGRVREKTAGTTATSRSADRVPEPKPKPKKTDDASSTASATASRASDTTAKPSSVGDRLVSAVRDAASDPPPKRGPTASVGAKVPPGVADSSAAKKRG
jgi:hypothetical protein